MYDFIWSILLFGEIYQKLFQRMQFGTIFDVQEGLPMSLPNSVIPKNGL